MILPDIEYKEKPGFAHSDHKFLSFIGNHWVKTPLSESCRQRVASPILELLQIWLTRSTKTLRRR